VSNTRRTIWYGIALFAGGVLWTTLWKDWGDLWKVFKGGVGLVFLFAALIALLLGFVQWREDRENRRRQEEEKRREQAQQTVAGG
jgi:hypothetical protein